MHLRPLLLACMVVISLLAGASLLRAEPDPSADKTLSPYFVVDGADPAVDRLPLKDTRVDVAVSGVIADVTVSQTYANDGVHPLHARYVFPASTRAAVYGMRMTIGDTTIVANIAERKKAEETYEKAKSEGKNASLLEEERPNVFTMSVANVMPKQTIAVELRYTELLSPRDGIYELAYPTVVGPRYSSKPASGARKQDRFVASPYQHQGEPPKTTLSIRAAIAAGMPIYDVTSPSHRIVQTMRDAAHAEVSLDPAEAHSGNRDFILRYRLSSEPISSGLLVYQGGDENFFLVMAQPPRRVDTQAVLAREYIFVVDVSGSMNGFPLDTAKRLMRELLGGLRPHDRFNVLLFASGSKLLAPASLAPNPDKLRTAVGFVDSAPGSGGTELGAAISQALAIPRDGGRSRTIVLVTDGYIEAEADVFTRIRDHLSDTNVFAFGIGSSVNRHLIEGVARAGQGEPFVVTSSASAAAEAARFRDYVRAPVLTDVRLAYSGIDAYDIEPQKLPDLFASRPVVTFGKFRGEPRGTFEITGKTANGPYRSILPITPAAAGDYRALRTLWARTRTANLMDIGNGDGKSGEITALGLKYGLLTPYTSFVAVAERVVNPAKAADDVDQPLPMPLGVSDLAVGDGAVTGGAEPDLPWVLGTAFALLALAYAAKRTSRSGQLTGADS